MRDCDNAVMRDRLPDLLHQWMPAADRAAVEAHVASCDACRTELDVLRGVQRALVAPRIDVQPIVAKLPAYKPQPAWVRAVSSTAMRAAAAVLLVVTGTMIFRDGSTVDVPDTLIAAATVQSAASEIAVGSLNDIAESDLKALLDAMARLEAVTPTEPEVVVAPSVGRSGSEP